jgi:hypothetical protein
MLDYMLVELMRILNSGCNVSISFILVAGMQPIQGLSHLSPNEFGLSEFWDSRHFGRFEKKRESPVQPTYVHTDGISTNDLQKKPFLFFEARVFRVLKLLRTVKRYNIYIRMYVLDDLSLAECLCGYFTLTGV